MVPPHWRSLMFVPANDVGRCEKAVRVAADAVILDLEDGVAGDAKAQARSRIAELSLQFAAAGVAVVVRINGDWRSAFADLEACIGPNVTSIMVPKVSDPGRLLVIGDLIGEIEKSRGLIDGHTALLPLIESPRALSLLGSVAQVPRVVGLGLGPEDYCLELGVATTPEALDLPCRLIGAACAPGLMALAVPFSIAAYRDVEGFTDAARNAAAYGINGALCIHPKQVQAAHEVWGSSAAQSEEARRVLEAWAAAQAAGKGVTSLDGTMIDRPVAERARAVLARTRGA